jgi:hypothetical protein
LQARTYNTIFEGKNFHAAKIEDKMIDDEDDNLDDLEIPQLNPAEVIANLSQYSIVKLCDIVICDRYLGFNNELGIACMEELGRRRANGETFNFEEYIDKEYNDLPKIEATMPDLKTALNQVISGIIK